MGAVQLGLDDRPGHPVQQHHRGTAERQGGGLNRRGKYGENLSTILQENDINEIKREFELFWRMMEKNMVTLLVALPDGVATRLQNYSHLSATPPGARGGGLNRRERCHEKNWSVKEQGAEDKKNKRILGVELQNDKGGGASFFEGWLTKRGYFSPSGFP